MLILKLKNVINSGMIMLTKGTNAVRCDRKMDH
jgi:hypothetical protein